MRTPVSVTTLVEDDTTSADRYGSPMMSPTITEYKGLVHELDSAETLNDRETASTLWDVLLPPEAVVASDSTLSWTDPAGNALTGRVEGVPSILQSTRGNHHVEVKVRTFHG